MAVVAIMALLAVGCDSEPDTKSTAVPIGQTSTGTAASLSGHITVFAAASLIDAFSEVASDFRSTNPDASVDFNFAGSPTLVTQLGQGATADVLATADTTNMRNALDAGSVQDAGKTFAKNALVIVVPKSNPGGVTTPKDLAKPGLKLVLAQEDVPVGNYARQALDKFAASATYGADFNAKVLANVVSEEPNVKAVVTKVQLGEADAGIAYLTDVTSGVSGDIMEIAIPDEFNVIATYPIALTKTPGAPAVAQAFIDYVLSAEGQATLTKYGFITSQ